MKKTRTKPVIIYAFDIDGTICDTRNGDYEHAKPYKRRIAKINKLFKKHTVYFFTARGTGTGKDWSELTTRQLKDWGVKCDKVVFGKPVYDILVDDKAFNDRHFFSNTRTI